MTKNLLINVNLAWSVSAGHVIVCVRLPSPLSVGVIVAPFPSEERRNDTVIPRYNAPRYNADLAITRFLHQKVSSLIF